MAGTSRGAKKGVATKREKYGHNYFEANLSKGRESAELAGSRKHPRKGFGSLSPEERSDMGRRGRAAQTGE